MVKRIGALTSALLVASAPFVFAQGAATGEQGTSREGQATAQGSGQAPASGQAQKAGQPQAPVQAAAGTSPFRGMVDVGFRGGDVDGDEARFERYRDMRNGANVTFDWGRCWK